MFSQTQDANVAGHRELAMSSSRSALILNNVALSPSASRSSPQALSFYFICMVYFNEQMLYSASNECTLIELINDFVEEMTRSLFSRPFEQKNYDYVLFLAVFNAVRLIFELYDYLCILHLQ